MTARALPSARRAASRASLCRALRNALPAILAALLLACLTAPAQAAGALPWLAPPAQQNATDNATEGAANATAQAAPQPPPAQELDAEGQAQVEVLRQFFRRQVTLDDGFLELFSRRVREGEALAFMAVQEMQRRRGLLERFRAAEVDLSGLVFTRVTAAPDLARIRVTGSYGFCVPPACERVDEDALYVLVPEMGLWKVFERREGWTP